MKYSVKLRAGYISTLISLIILQIFATDPEHPWEAALSVTYSTCKNFKCRERARYLEDSLDQSTNPCDDFYQYACGGWIKKHPVPTTEMEYSIETYLKIRTTMKVKQLLDQSDHPADKKEVKIARKLYRECMRRHELGRMDARTVILHLSKQGSWHLCSTSDHYMGVTKSWTKILEYFLEISNDTPLFDIFIGLNKNEEPTIQIEEIAEPFVMLDVLRWSHKKEYFYMKFLKQLIKTLKIYNLATCKIDGSIREVIQFRKKLDEIIEFITETTIGSGKSIEEMTIEQFQDWYNNKTETFKPRVNIPWLALIRAAYPTINGVNVNANTLINVRNKEYFELIARLLNETPVRVIVNHIKLYFVEGHLRMNSKLIKSLKEVILQDDTFYDDLVIDTDKFHFCILNHPMKEALANMYNDVYLTKEIEKSVFDLAENVKAMMKLQMARSKWLHSTVKYQISQKLSRTNVFIGIKDMSVSNEKRPWLHGDTSSMRRMTPSILPEASYVLSDEYVLMGTGYLQSPVFEKEMPFVLNYGSLGSLLGHEFFHSFQSALSNKFNKSRKKEQNVTSDIYTEKTKCFVDHYKDFDVTDLSDLPSNLYIRPDLVRTVEENVADTMGLKAAYEAYRKKLWENNSVCLRPLPVSLKFSCDQLFFLSFALTFCGNIPSMEIRKMLKHLEHLPPRIRVNGAVSNSKAFNDAFQCPKKKPLNAKKKCDIWE